MWADNETDVDLCGFDYLVDQLEVVLSRKELRPVTVGLSGGWGSGKSSLMRMAQSRLEGDDKNVCCSFSPWRYEDYDDIKHSLMVAVLDALAAKVDAESSVGKHLGRIRGLADRLRLARLVVSGGLAAVGADLALAAAAGEAADAVTAKKELVAPDPLGSAGLFRSEFQALMEELGDSVSGLYVFIDDLDRCMPQTVLDTLEAVRLFLHVPNTAYVIAADPSVVREAIRGRYAQAGIVGDEIGTDYLEKIWQFTVSVPALAVPEVETYIGLLFSRLHLRDDQFDLVREATEENRKTDQLAVAMNYGFAGTALGEDIPEPLQRDFVLTNRIAPQIAEGLRGNPREIKRFLNTLLVKLEAASRRGIELRPDVLAKLMILEERHLHRFRQLYGMQVSAGGTPKEIVEAERLAREEDKDATDVATEWSKDTAVESWLRLDPKLDGVGLGPYFSYARDKILATGATSRLPAELQALLAPLLGDGDSARNDAIGRVRELDPASRAMLFGAATEAVIREPTARALRTLGEVARHDEALVPALIGALREVPKGSIPKATPAHFKTIFGNGEHRFDEVLPTSLGA